MVAVGAIHAFALLHLHARVRRISLVTAMFIWLVIAMSFFVSNPMGTGVLTYGLFAVGCFMCLMRSERNLP